MAYVLRTAVAQRSLTIADPGAVIAQRPRMTNPDVQRREALCELLTLRDSFDELRRHRTVLDGSPDRHQQIPRLVAAYIQTKLTELRDRAELREH